MENSILIFLTKAARVAKRWTDVGSDQDVFNECLMIGLIEKRERNGVLQYRTTIEGDIELVLSGEVGRGDNAYINAIQRISTHYSLLNDGSVNRIVNAVSLPEFFKNNPKYFVVRHQTVANPDFMENGRFKGQIEIEHSGKNQIIEFFLDQGWVDQIMEKIAWN